MISREKLKILTPLQKLPKNVWDLGKLIVAKALKMCRKSNKSPNLVTLFTWHIILPLILIDKIIHLTWFCIWFTLKFEEIFVHEMSINRFCFFSTSFLWPPFSVTWWLEHLSTFGHLQQWKLAQKCHKMCQSRLSILPNKKSTVKLAKETCNFNQSGEISPNLVTLPPLHALAPLGSDFTCCKNRLKLVKCTNSIGHGAL